MGTTIDKISLVCKTLVVGSIQCPIRPTDPELPPSCHAMNNGAAVVYINMQEPCFEDLSQMCSADESTNFSENTIAATDNKPDHAFKELCVAVKAKRHHAFKDLCVAVGDFCGNELFGCNFVATTQYRCDAIGERPKPIAENSASCGSTKACLCPASSTGLICGGELPKECKAYKNSVYDCSGGAGTTPKLSGHCEPGVLCRKDHASEDATCGSINCECYGDREVCSGSFPAECSYEKNTIYRCTKSGKPVKVTDCKVSSTCISHSDGATCWPDECRCQKDGLACGRAFPLSCKLRIDALYRCTKGGEPVFASQCPYPDGCSLSGPPDDTCIDGCICRAAGTVCLLTAFA